MRYLSVCSGIEAVSVAWQPLGWQPAMFAEIDPFCCWLLRSRYRASRPQHMPSPHEASDRKEAKRRAAAIRNVVALPADGARDQRRRLHQDWKTGCGNNRPSGRRNTLPVFLHRR